MDNTHKKKRAVDKATAFTKWCGKDLKYPALLFLLMAFSSLIMFQDYLLGDQLIAFLFLYHSRFPPEEPGSMYGPSAMENLPRTERLYGNP